MPASIIWCSSSIIQQPVPAEQTYARKAATQFIEKNAGPNRLMAIAEFGGALKVTQNFTEDADRLKQVVAGVKFASVGSASTGIGGGLRGAGSGRMNAAFNDYSIRGVLGALRSMAKGLSEVPGRKTLIFLSGGFPMTQAILTEITATIDACNRANVAIYPIDIRGLVAPGIGAVGELRGFRSLAQMAMLQASPLINTLALQGRGGTSLRWGNIDRRRYVHWRRPIFGQRRRHQQSGLETRNQSGHRNHHGTRNVQPARRIRAAGERSTTLSMAPIMSITR